MFYALDSQLATLKNFVLPAAHLCVGNITGVNRNIRRGEKR